MNVLSTLLHRKKLHTSRPLVVRLGWLFSIALEKVLCNFVSMSRIVQIRYQKHIRANTAYLQGLSLEMYISLLQCYFEIQTDNLCLFLCKKK